MFHRMRVADAVLLLVVFGLSALGFLLPVLRDYSWHGVSLFGWWMAGLMVLGPLAGFLHMARDK